MAATNRSAYGSNHLSVHAHQLKRTRLPIWPEVTTLVSGPARDSLGARLWI